MNDFDKPQMRAETTWEELGKNLKDLAAQNRSLKSLADTRSHTIGKLQSQLDTARRTFGEAFVRGHLSPVGSKRPNRPKLSERDAKDIRQAYQGGMKQAELARNYGVNPATISRLVRGIYH
ncbi:HTH DNA binding protein [Mycobacterium phage EagleEye]|uniref:HTH DNA binding protein n=1 Tax=Mycobacterium phage EagleEye TaxID=1429759 RepID=W0LMQ9_9CAUD|nr:HTH DNA binding protein [Mycobacterium phage EagleEye]AHG23829.1 HTH DNA binding protein [Mycobacterium phage EagleEye]QDK03482.1 helix-turn-helix DNA-binding domain protein [Mycobacterium phage Lucyedi]QNJ55835.1 helix-turn-helix DNA-binding domain protein [Mycobacterium phage PainterBoy]